MPSTIAALADGLLDVLGDVGDGQPAGGAQLVLELERLHDAGHSVSSAQGRLAGTVRYAHSRGPVAQLVRAADS